MSPSRDIAKTGLVALAFLAMCAVVFVVIVTIFNLNPGITLSAGEKTSQSIFLFLGFFYFGLFPVLIYGVPTYVFLMHRGWARWWSSVLVGLLPGMILLSIDLSLAEYALAAGSVVALLTHSVMPRRANNSFKPKPLRGSA